jgi:hypothetical protein
MPLAEDAHHPPEPAVHERRGGGIQRQPEQVDRGRKVAIHGISLRGSRWLRRRIIGGDA